VDITEADHRHDRRQVVETYQGDLLVGLAVLRQFGFDLLGFRGEVLVHLVDSQVAVEVHCEHDLKRRGIVRGLEW
jgi:hypothetical protein